ncbi:MAG: polymerase, sigma-24 subunit, subfamily [Mucilaginibacter sp.]|nr:polymerase, sigma-24 subunit, subfamily [Mucilaginibacter sp.]
MKQENITYGSDKELVAGVLGGDSQAFAQIIRQTEGLVAQMVYTMAGPSAERKDLVQDIYMKAYQNLPGFRFHAKLSTWVGQIAYHTCLHYLKRKKLYYPDEFPEEEVAIGELSANEIFLFDKELSGILQSAIARLPPLYQTLVSLFHQEELSYQEIREITGLPEGTVKNYLFRARKALRQDLLKRYDKNEL